MPLLNSHTTPVIPYQIPGYSSVWSTAQASNMKTPNNWSFVKRIGDGFPKRPETQKAIPFHAIVMELDVWPRWHLKAVNYHLLDSLRSFHGDIIGCTRLSYSLMSNHNTTQNNTVFHTARNERCVIYIRYSIFGRHHLPCPHRQAIRCLNCYGKLNTLRSKQRGRHFEDAILKLIVLHENCCIMIYWFH